MLRIVNALCYLSIWHNGAIEMSQTKTLCMVHIPAATQRFQRQLKINTWKKKLHMKRCDDACVWRKIKCVLLIISGIWVSDRKKKLRIILKLSVFETNGTFKPGLMCFFPVQFTCSFTIISQKAPIVGTYVSEHIAKNCMYAIDFVITNQLKIELNHRTKS